MSFDSIINPLDIVCIWSIEFSLNYAKLTTLAIKTCVGESKINSENFFYLKWGLNLGLLVIHSDTYLTELTYKNVQKRSEVDIISTLKSL